MAKRAPYETPLTASEEQAFGEWKTKYAPNDSGVDYDLRGAFKAGLTPDKTTGHWPDTFKKPNHPTFSPESIYHPNNPVSPLGALNGITREGPAAGPPKTLDAAAQRRILGVTPSQPRTAAQVADQAAFDRTFGFDRPSAQQVLDQRAARLAKDPYDLEYAETGGFANGTHPVIAADKTSRARGDGTIVQPEVRRATIAAAPAAVSPTPGVVPNSGGLAMLSGVPKDANFNAEPPAVPQFGGLKLNTDLTSSDPALARPPEPPGRAERAGQTIRRVVGGVLGAIPRESQFGPTNYSAPAATSDTPLFDLPKAIAGFTRGVLGRSTEAGVSRAQVARIQQPTAENPVPTTDTTPVANIDDSKDAIRKFGSNLTDWTGRKFAFSGF